MPRLIALQSNLPLNELVTCFKVRMADHVSPATSPTQGSSRSESSSPTSVRPRARASSADDSSKKEIRQNRDKGERKETIEDWEIPIDDIFIGPRIGAGSFGQHQRPLFCTRSNVWWSQVLCTEVTGTGRSRSKLSMSAIPLLAR